MNARTLGINFARCLVWVEAGTAVGECRDVGLSLRHSGGWYVTLTTFTLDGGDLLRVDTGGGATIEDAAEQALEFAAVQGPRREEESVRGTLRLVEFHGLRD